MERRILTKRQQEVYQYIKWYIEMNSISPYIREIQDGCKIQCYKSAVDKLLALEKKGYIKRSLNKHRSIKLNPRSRNPRAKAPGISASGRELQPLGRRDSTNLIGV